MSLHSLPRGLGKARLLPTVLPGCKRRKLKTKLIKRLLITACTRTNRGLMYKSKRVLSVAAAKKNNNRVYRRYKEFVRGKETKHTREDLEIYADSVKKLRNELAQYVEDNVDSVDSVDLLTRPMGAVVKEFVDSFVLHSQKMVQIAQSGHEVTDSYYKKQLEACMTPRVRKIFGCLSVSKEFCRSVAISACVISGMKLCGADIFENFMSPVLGWRIPWLFWTAPYAIATFYFWNSRISKKWKPLQGFKLSTNYATFRPFILQDPRSYHESTLLLHSVQAAWITTVYQGLGFYLFEAIFPLLYGTDVYSISFTLHSPLPAIAWVPVELLTLGSIAGTYQILLDWSLIISAEELLKDRERFSHMDARIVAKSEEEFNLLNDPLVTRDRAAVTFVYYFLTVGYLSIEALSVHSLFASLATLTIGHYLTLKGMQKSNT